MELYHKYGGMIGGIVGFFILWANDKVTISLKEATACLILTVFAIIYILLPYAESAEWANWLKALCGLGIGAGSQTAILVIPKFAGKALNKMVKIATSIAAEKLDNLKDEEDKS